jgi:hypothetical protein
LSSGIGYHPTAAWRSSIPCDRKLAIDDPFILGFRDGGWMQELTSDAIDEEWPFASDKAWLAVPLSHRRKIVGFVLLDRANHTVSLNWEAFDLLRATGRPGGQLSRRGALDQGFARYRSIDRVQQALCFCRA